jgi:hypothetical protein
VRTLRPAPLVVAAILATGLLMGCRAGSDNPTIQVPSPTASPTSPPSSPTQTATSTTGPAAAVTSPASVPSSTPTKAPAASYTTIPSAEAYVATQAVETGFSFGFIAPDATWGQTAVLHGLRATPQGAAGYGGDYYYFFVDGRPVGRQYFTGPVTDRRVDASTLSVTYPVYKPGDAHCCPSGGMATATLHWNGSKLVSVPDPIPGATQN